MSKRKKNENKIGFLGKLIIFFIILGSFGYIYERFNPEQANQNNETTVESTTSVESTTTVESQESTEQETNEAKYDRDELNSKIIDSLIEAQTFDDEGADGYEWSRYVSDLSINEHEALYVEVTDDFKLLDDNDKISILESAQRCAGAQYFLLTEEQRSFYTKAFDNSGNKVGESGMFNHSEYKFE